MKRLLPVFFLFIFSASFSQTTPPARQGDHAPSFILTLNDNAIQSYVMPYLKSIVMLHFWSSDVITSRVYGQRLSALQKRYNNVVYKNADGFEVVAIAVQTNKKSWKEAIAADSLSRFTHGIALQGFEDNACKKYGVVSLPTDVLIDENGTIIAIDPKMTDIENILDERKNFQPVKKDVIGTLAQSSNKAEVLKYSKLYLFNNYGDSIGKTETTVKGGFTFSDIKLNQDFILKVDNKTDMITSDPIALYTPTGELLLDGVTNEGGFIFHIPARLSYRLTEPDHMASPAANEAQINIIKNLDFMADGNSLSQKDQKDLLSILTVLQKSKTSVLEFTTNTDSKLDDNAAMQLTVKQAATLMSWFEKKGIAKTRLKSIAKGNDEPRIICDQAHVCSEDDHKENRRVEFFIHKN